MRKRIMLIDGNSIGHQANNTAILRIGNQETQAINGFLKILRGLLDQYAGSTPIVLWDGFGWRKQLLETYKDNRDKCETQAEIKAQERKKAYASQRPHIQRALSHLGVPQLMAPNMEADDLAGILTKRYKSGNTNILLVTGDQDWLQLVDSNVSWRDQVNNRMVTTANFEEFTGVKTVRQFVELKALMGDAGDGVPGVGGIGKKGAIEFLNTYGSVVDFYQAVSIEKSIDPATLHKKYRDLATDEEKIFNFKRNVALVDLNTPLRPAPAQLTNSPGVPSLPEFQAFCENFLLNVILKQLHTWLEPFPSYQQMLVSQAA